MPATFGGGGRCEKTYTNSITFSYIHWKYTHSPIETSAQNHTLKTIRFCHAKVDAQNHTLLSCESSNILRSQCFPNNANNLSFPLEIRTQLITTAGKSRTKKNMKHHKKNQDNQESNQENPEIRWKNLDFAYSLLAGPATRLRSLRRSSKLRSTSRIVYEESTSCNPTVVVTSGRADNDRTKS